MELLIFILIVIVTLVLELLIVSGVMYGVLNAMSMRHGCSSINKKHKKNDNSVYTSEYNHV